MGREKSQPRARLEPRQQGRDLAVEEYAKPEVRDYGQIEPRLTFSPPPPP
jgi:hypothetical protein